MTGGGGALQRILLNILPHHCFALLMMDGKVIAAGLGVLQAGYIGLFDIVVDQEFRSLRLWTADGGKHPVLGKTEWGAVFLFAGHAQQDPPALHFTPKSAIRKDINTGIASDQRNQFPPCCFFIYNDWFQVKSAKLFYHHRQCIGGCKDYETQELEMCRNRCSFYYPGGSVLFFHEPHCTAVH